MGALPYAEQLTLQLWGLLTTALSLWYQPRLRNVYAPVLWIVVVTLQFLPVAVLFVQRDLVAARPATALPVCVAVTLVQGVLWLTCFAFSCVRRRRTKGYVCTLASFALAELVYCVTGFGDWKYDTWVQSEPYLIPLVTFLLALTVLQLLPAQLVQTAPRATALAGLLHLIFAAHWVMWGHFVYQEGFADRGDTAWNDLPSWAVALATGLAFVNAARWYWRDVCLELARSDGTNGVDLCGFWLLVSLLGCFPSLRCRSDGRVESNLRDAGERDGLLFSMLNAARDGYENGDDP